MSKVGIFYGSQGGATESAAYDISEELIRRGFSVDVCNIADASLDEFDRFDNIILGTSTMGMQVMQDDWENVLHKLTGKNLAGKKVALFGTGDQETYPDTFADGIGVLFDALQGSNAVLVGRWSTDVYVFRESNAVVDRKFVGLVLDEDTQHPRTRARIKAWVDDLADKFY